MKHNYLILLFLFQLSSTIISAQNGLRGEYYNGTNFEKKVFIRNDPKIDFNWGLNGPKPGIVDKAYYSIKWSGFITIPETGKYGFSAVVDDGFRVWINNVLILDSWQLHDSKAFKRYAMLTEGKSYPIRIEYFNDLLHGVFKLYWSLPNQESVPIDAQYFKLTKPNEAPKIEQSIAIKPTIEPNILKVKVAEKQIKPAPIIELPKQEILQKNIPKIDLETLVSLDDNPKTKVIFFEIGADSLTENSKIRIEKLYNFLKNHPKTNLKLEGHSDVLGDKIKNLELSQSRSDKIANYLIERGIARNRISKACFGSTSPLFSKPKTDSEHAANRRVEFEFIE
jgi:outer membrane protein OmpA-like peptidoglycan-associated protein